MSTFEYLLPDLGEGIAEAEVISWVVDVDAEVHAHEPLLVVETDKAQVELPCPVDGVLTSRGAREGTVVKVGSVVASFAVEPGATGHGPAGHGATGNGSVGDSASRNGSGLPGAASGQLAAGQSPTRTQADAAAPSSGDGAATPSRAVAAPTVRRLAVEHGIDLATIRGTGPGGRVVKDDVLRAAQAGQAPVPETAAEEPASPAPSVTRPTPALDEADVTRVPLRGTRRTIARKMTTVIQTVPMVSGHQEIDVTELKARVPALRARAQTEGVRLTWTALFALATTHALRRYPQINAHLDMDAEELTIHRRINLGMAASIEGGLVVPVIRDAARLSLLEIAAEIERLSEAARSRTISREELSGATFTLTNYGAVGGWFGTMIVNTPEVGIIGFGEAVERALVVNGEIAVRTVIPLSSTFDHRVVDGALGAQFTGAIKAQLEDPDLLFLGGRHVDG